MLYYIIPLYMDGHGSCCKVAASDGSLVREESLHSAFRKLLQEKCIDIKTVRKVCSKVLLQKNLIPLYLSKDEILMPVKVRKPRVKRDGGYGYVNYKAVCNMEGSSLILINGERIFYMESQRTVARRLKACERLSLNMKSKSMGVYTDLPGNTGDLATKEDMALLAREMLYIRHQLEKLTCK